MTPASSTTLSSDPKEQVRGCARLLVNPEVRLITLTGEPGVGKTWLARELVATLNTQLTEPVQMVPLAELDNWLLFLPHLAEQLGVEVEGQSLWAVKEAVAAHLGSKKTLLILDAFETVMPAAATVADLLKTCPDLTVIVTSRLPLGLANERVLQVPTPQSKTSDLRNSSKTHLRKPVTSASQHSSTSFDVDDYDDPSQVDKETLALLTEALTEREIDVLKLVARGLSNRQVAGRLDISHRTVSTHLSNIYGKLNVRTRTAAALRARQLELVSDF